MKNVIVLFMILINFVLSGCLSFSLKDEILKTAYCPSSYIRGLNVIPMELPSIAEPGGKIGLNFNIVNASQKSIFLRKADILDIQVSNIIPKWNGVKEDCTVMPASESNDFYKREFILLRKSEYFKGEPKIYPECIYSFVKYYSIPKLEDAEAVVLELKFKIDYYVMGEETIVSERFIKEIRINLKSSTNTSSTPAPLPPPDSKGK